MSDTQPKLTRCAKKQENINFNMEKKSIKLIDQGITEIMELVNKDYKIAKINIENVLRF